MVTWLFTPGACVRQWSGPWVHSMPSKEEIRSLLHHSEVNSQNTPLEESSVLWAFSGPLSCCLPSLYRCPLLQCVPLPSHSS